MHVRCLPAARRRLTPSPGHYVVVCRWARSAASASPSPAGWTRPPARARGPRARGRPGARRCHRRLPEPGRRRAGSGATTSPRGDRAPGGRGRRPTRATLPPTARTGRTAASTARTSCSRGSPTRSSAPHAARRRGLRRERRRRAAAGPAGRPGGDRATPCCARWPTPGLTKADVRALARALGLPNADKPAAPCLASRIPHFYRGRPGEAGAGRGGRARRLRALGFADCRVRHHGDVGAGRAARGRPRPRRGRPRCGAPVHEAVRAAGFRFVAVDLAGIQSGAFTLPLVAVTVADGGTGRAIRRATCGRRRARPRTGRPRRGYPEAVYCEGKTAGAGARHRGDACGRTAGRPLFTRASPEHAGGGAARCCPTRCTTRSAGCWPGPPGRRSRWAGCVARRSCAGTSDLPVAREAAAHGAHLGRARSSSSTSGWPGCTGSSGGWTLLRAARVIVVVAGMDGALPSVVAGLVGRRSSRCPTSVGYGAAFEGLAALLAMLNACAPGVGRRQHRQRVRRRAPGRADRRRPG